MPETLVYAHLHIHSFPKDFLMKNLLKTKPKNLQLERPRKVRARHCGNPPTMRHCGNVRHCGGPPAA